MKYFAVGCLLVCGCVESVSLVAMAASYIPVVIAALQTLGLIPA